MKRLLVVALVISIICLPALAQKKGSDDFNDLIKRYYAAWNTLNPDNASFLYAQDADLVFFDIAPLKYSGGWPEYRENFKKNVAPGFSSLTLTPNNDVKVTRRGNLALTTLTFHLSAKQKDGTPLEFDARHTIVWEKRGGQWLIIHEHVSKPLF
ncbi:MAG TPA: nuclear transport factor 2 family protein [Pyrinomonadaceae bacterium]|nr:nuclear transport factor 2 family protein [Pyrinomonadaceae bacterium]